MKNEKKKGKKMKKQIKKKRGKLQFSKKWKNAIFLEFLSFVYHFFIILFYHFSSFLIPVVQKFSKKWKITSFLEFFSFFYHFFMFLSFFKIFASSGGIDEKW